MSILCPSIEAVAMSDVVMVRTIKVNPVFYDRHVAPGAKVVCHEPVVIAWYIDDFFELEDATKYKELRRCELGGGAVKYVTDQDKGFINVRAAKEL
jgi:hypothetical protein